MAEASKSLSERLKARFESAVAVREGIDMVELEVDAGQWLDVARALRDEPGFRFEQLSDLAGVDYLGYGQGEWDVSDVSSEGFSRGVEGTGPGRFRWEEGPGLAALEHGRFAVVVHLLSYHHNQRLRLSCRCPDGPVPIVASLVEVWPGANWFEREAFDLFGIVFEGHPDLRRLLTDYGFVGHPFRKDFPLIGNVEVRYDPDKGRVVYQPVSIEPRVGVPRVVRNDSRYLQAKAEQQSRDGQG